MFKVCFSDLHFFCLYNDSHACWLADGEPGMLKTLMLQVVTDSTDVINVKHWMRMMVLLVVYLVIPL